MEVAGSAVGIASLGIQVCQGLLSYYDAWKSYDSDISGTYDAVTDLNKTLTILKTTLREEVDRERVGRVDTCVKGCEDALLKLDEKRRSLQEYSQPEGLRQKMRSGLQRSWYPFRKETLAALKGNVTDVQERLKLALQVLQLDVGTELQREVLRLMSQTKMQSDSLAQMAAQNQRILDAQQSDEFRKIVAWLAPPDPGTNHDTARQRHESQTGQWLLKSSQYRSWKTGAVSHLWMHGKAGCGKTILCSTAIEDIRTTCEQDADTCLAFFYFSFSDERKQSDSDMLRSLVAQLGRREPGLSMLRQAYGDAKGSVPGPDELEKILLASTRSCSKIYLCIDALDECPEDYETRQSVLARIERLTQDAPNLKVLATSRELERIRKSMEALVAEPLRVTTHAVDDDIQLYLAKEISRDRSLCELSPDMRTLIESTIASQADGMFRWAYCQLQELKSLDSYKPKYVKHVLQTLPPTLDDTYTRMLTRIKEMYYQEALTLLRWLAYARSPPTLGELIDAAITDPVEESFVDTSERGGLCDALNILAGLVTVEEEQVADTENHSTAGFASNDTPTAVDDQGAKTFNNQHLTTTTRIRLAHFSVKEYLESERISKSSAKQFYLESATGHRALSQSCLTYMRYYSASPEKTLKPRDLETFPLLKYAAQSWFYHCALQQGGETCREVSFLQHGQAKDDWLLVHDPDFGNKPFPAYKQTTEAPGSAIYYASLLGLSVVVHSLLASGADVNAKGGLYGSAVQAAALRGHTAIVQLLVDLGADVNAQGGDYGSAVQAAALSDRLSVLDMLCGRDGYLTNYDSLGRNALSWVAIGGHHATVRTLIDRCTEPLSSPSDVFKNHDNLGCSMIHHFVMGGSVEGVAMVLDAGIDINTVDSQGWTALHWASYLDLPEIGSYLVNSGAQTHFKNLEGWDALDISLYVGSESFANLLGDLRTLGLSTKTEALKLRGLCDSCRRDLIGVQYHCTECEGFDLCFRCIKEVQAFHPHNFDHEFRYGGTED